VVNLILEDASIWTLYGTTSGTQISVQGLATGVLTTYGPGSSTSSALVASLTNFPVPGSSVSPASLTGTYSASTGIAGTLVLAGVSESINLTIPAITTYDYDAPASIASISGTWQGGMLDGETATITFAANGNISGLSSLGCTFTGTTIARPSGKSVFNVSITFGGSPCANANLSETGIAITSVVAGSGGKNQLIIGAIDSTKTHAFAFAAVR
jgi:hypothetical protein